MFEVIDYKTATILAFIGTTHSHPSHHSHHAHHSAPTLAIDATPRVKSSEDEIRTYNGLRYSLTDEV